MTSNQAYEKLRGLDCALDAYESALKTGINLRLAEDEVAVVIANTPDLKEALAVQSWLSQRLIENNFEIEIDEKGIQNKRSAFTEKSKTIDSWDFIKREPNRIAVIDEKHGDKIRKYWIRKLEAVQHKQEQLNKEAVRLQELIEKI